MGYYKIELTVYTLDIDQQGLIDLAWDSFVGRDDLILEENIVYKVDG